MLLMYHVIKYVQSLTNVSVNNEINKKIISKYHLFLFSFFDNSIQVAEYYRIIRILQNPQSQNHTIPQLHFLNYKEKKKKHT